MTATHDELLADLLISRLDIDGLIREHDLSPAQLRAFCNDPEVIETLRCYEDLRARRHRVLTEERQSTAAEHLHNALLDAKGPEIRLTASALTAVCRVRTPRALEVVCPETTSRVRPRLPGEPGPNPQPRALEVVCPETTSRVVPRLPGEPGPNPQPRALEVVCPETTSRVGPPLPQESRSNPRTRRVDFEGTVLPQESPRGSLPEPGRTTTSPTGTIAHDEGS